MAGIQIMFFVLFCFTVIQTMLMFTMITRINKLEDTNRKLIKHLDYLKLKLVSIGNRRRI
jgi:hypothetical protein